MSTSLFANDDSDPREPVPTEERTRGALPYRRTRTRESASLPETGRAGAHPYRRTRTRGSASLPKNADARERIPTEDMDTQERIPTEDTDARERFPTGDRTRRSASLPKTWTRRSASLPNYHLDRFLGAQCHRCFRFHCLAWNYFKSPTAQNFGQHNSKLHPGEAFANAGSWPTAKRKESILRHGALKFRRPTIWIKLGRVRKISVAAVHGPLATQNNRTFGYRGSSDLQIPRRSPADSPNRRIKAQGFADDPE